LTLSKGIIIETQLDRLAQVCSTGHLFTPGARALEHPRGGLVAFKTGCVELIFLVHHRDVQEVHKLAADFTSSNLYILFALFINCRIHFILLVLVARIPTSSLRSKYSLMP
jgi:hypothetical protein